ncbi:hypothetical protein F511_42595 [Dorcoceras hygrometricum]|uniref:Uncharacterized protein n=1 Tax=Dorcoceras hygrometricum TaxID=472368 RepID=A0A2Z7DE10_9LAMI|nr:hypothetical protein F511_42595 [Dorcoceras hygrometricum]
MPPRRRGRGRGQVQEESEGQIEEVQRSVPRRGRDRQIDLEVDEGARVLRPVSVISIIWSRERAKRTRFLEELYSLVLASSPNSYAEAVDSAINIEEGLRNRRSRGRPQVAQSSHPLVQRAQPFQSVQSSQPPQQKQQVSQQFGHQRFRPRGKQFKKKYGSSSSGSGSSSSGGTKVEYCGQHDDSSGHDTSNVGPFRHDGSVGRSQRAKGFISKGNQAQYLLPPKISSKLSTNSPFKSAASPAHGETQQSTIQLSLKLKMGKNHLPKAAKEQKNYWSTITKRYEHCNYFMLLKSGDSGIQTGINRKS